MKTMKVGAIALLFMFGFGYLSAQSAAGSSKEVVSVSEQTSAIAQAQRQDSVDNTRSSRGIPTPANIEEMFQQGQIKQALAEFERFKKTQRSANPYNLLFLEMTIYQQAYMSDPANGAQYQEKVESIRQQLIAKYPNVSDTYLLQIDENTTPEQVVELMNKAIEADPENIAAYENRARALFQLGKAKEGCADLEKSPNKNNMPEYWECNKE